jgi:signal transduction histidine kinase
VLGKLRKRLNVLSAESVTEEDIKHHGPNTSELLSEAHALTRTVVCEFAEHNTVDLSAVLEYVLGENRADIERRGITLVQEGEWPKVKYIWGRSTECAFVIDNLVANAIQAMDGAEVRRLTIRKHKDPGIHRFRLDVEDTGKGIAEELYERIFDNGYTTRPGGTGAGLGRSRQIMSATHGAIRLVRSEQGRGSLFRAEFVELKDEEIETWLKNRRNRKS